LDAPAYWGKYLNSHDERISLDAWKYLNDRAYGKAQQAVTVSGDDEKPLGFRVEIVHVGSPVLSASREYKR